MPLADVHSRGCQISIWYDVYGLDATEPQSDTTDGELDEPKRLTPVTRLLGSVLGAAGICKILPSTANDPSRNASAAKPETVPIGSSGHEAAVEGATSTRRDATASACALGQAPASSSPSRKQALPETQALCPPSAFQIEADAGQTPAPSESGVVQTESGKGEGGLPAQASEASERLASLDVNSDQRAEAEDFEGRETTANRPSEEAEAIECNRVLFIAGLGARGRTEFFQHVVEHLASLVDRSGAPLLSVCTFDNRGIGGSSIPAKRRKYTTKAMAYDTLALLDHLGWPKVHVVGLSLGGMIGCKMAAMDPHRIATLTLIGTTPSGWHMLAGISTQPVMATLAGSGPLRWKIPANLRYNFTDRYLEEVVEGGKTRMEVLKENTQKAIAEKDTGKFLAEGQPTIGREGHLAAVFKHRMFKWELEAITESGIPCQVVVGRYDRLARAHYAARLAKQLRCTHVIVEAAHAGIMIEAIDTLIPLLEASVLGTSRTSAGHVRRLGALTNEEVLQNQLYAKEFASSFAPGRVSFKSAKSSGVAESKKSGFLPRSKSAA